jgi:hypothetical protein
MRQLKTIKGADNKTTLMDFLVKTVEHKCPDALDIDRDLAVSHTAIDETIPHHVI